MITFPRLNLSLEVKLEDVFVGNRLILGDLLGGESTDCLQRLSRVDVEDHLSHDHRLHGGGGGVHVLRALKRYEAVVEGKDLGPLVLADIDFMLLPADDEAKNAIAIEGSDARST